MKKIKWKSINRNIHYWGSAICAVPILLVIVTGILLLLRKELSWVQPPSMQGQGVIPTISFEHILSAAQRVEEANIKGWHDIERLDVRPEKGMLKVRAKNGWEIQIDHQNAKILQVAYRRSGLIESLHEGTFFSRNISYFVFLPAAVILLILLITGIYLFMVGLPRKIDNARRKRAAIQTIKCD